MFVVSRGCDAWLELKYVQCFVNECVNCGQNRDKYEWSVLFGVKLSSCTEYQVPTVV